MWPLCCAATVGGIAAASYTRAIARKKMPSKLPSNAAILLVEDHVVNQQLATSMLGKWGHDVTLAQNGREAVDLFPTDAFDLVLMDMQMPIMDGLKATREIRLIPERRRTPILSITANAFVEDKARCLEAGMDDFIAKPVRPDALFLTLLRWLRTRG